MSWPRVSTDAEGRRRFAVLYLRGGAGSLPQVGSDGQGRGPAGGVPRSTRATGCPAAAGGVPARRPSRPGTRRSTWAPRCARRRPSRRRSSCPRLLDKLMEVCLATTGAERGALLLAGGGGFWCCAPGGPSPSPPRCTGSRWPAAAHLPRSMVEQVQESRAPLVLADASAHLTFGADPYVRAQRVRSALALPHVAAGPAGRRCSISRTTWPPACSGQSGCGFLQLLSSQIASALENGRLFERLAQEQQALRFLAEAGAALAESLDYERTLRRVAQLAVSWLADACTVYIRGGRRGAAHGLGHRADPAHQQAAGPGRPAPHRDRLAVLRASRWSVRARRSSCRRSAAPSSPDSARTSRRSDAARRWGCESVMVLPLPARGRVAGGHHPGQHRSQTGALTTATWRWPPSWPAGRRRPSTTPASIIRRKRRCACATSSCPSPPTSCGPPSPPCD